MEASAELRLCCGFRTSDEHFLVNGQNSEKHEDIEQVIVVDLENNLWRKKKVYPFFEGKKRGDLSATL